jgi:hypothetical protein
MHLLTLMFNKVNVMFNLLSKGPSFRRENETPGPNRGSSVRACENQALSVVDGRRLSIMSAASCAGTAPPTVRG